MQTRSASATPATVLVVSTRLTPARRQALRDLVAPEGRPELIDPTMAGSRLSDPGLTAVVLDGPGAAVDLTELGPGVAVVAIGCPVDGAAPTDGEAYGEIVVRATSPEDPLTQRLDPEFTMVDAFTPLDVADMSFRTVLAVNYRFVDRPVVAARGRTVVSGLGNTDRALADPGLSTVLWPIPA